MKQIYISLIAVLLLSSVDSHAQAQTDVTYTQEADRQLQNVSKAQATTGVLYDRVLRYFLEMFQKIYLKSLLSI